MKRVILWIEMLKQASELVGLNTHYCDRDDVQLERRESLQSFCEYRLKSAIEKLHEEAKRLAEQNFKLREDKARLVDALRKTSEYLTHLDNAEFQQDKFNQQLLTEIEGK